MTESTDSQFLFSKALTFAQSQQYVVALDLLTQILKIDPMHENALQLSRGIFNNLPNKNESINLLKEFIEISGSSPTLLYELGSLHLELGNYSESISTLTQALELSPNSFESLHDLGAAYALSGNKMAASENFLKASKINSESPDLFYNLGRLYDDQLLFEQAIGCYQKAVNLNPLFTEAWINLGVDLGGFNKYPEALKCFETAFEQNPDIDFLYGDCLFMRMRMCDWKSMGAVKSELKNLIEGNKIPIAPFPLSALFDSPSLNLKIAELYSHAKYPPDFSLGPLTPNKNEKIRVAYFSPDFHEHPVSFLMAEVFKLHNRSQFEIYAFSFGKPTEDAMRKRLEKSFDHFIDVTDQSPIEIAALSREMNIDVAIDLCGFTENARTEIFALRAAPIQISYIGFLGTMGSDYIDYLIADEVIIPQHLRQFYSEKIIYLPSYQANDSRRAASSRHFSKADFGIQENQFVFCNLNNVYKITEEVFNSWMVILKDVPNSVMLLYAENPIAAENLKRQAIKSGIDSKRLVFAERLPRPDYLARYHIADLFLDTFPYNAGTTASDALWMDVPVITLQGESFTSRVASSLLTHLDLPELIHRSISEYQEQAIALGTFPDRLKDLKNKLINNKLNTPLFNSRIFVHNLEKALGKVHQLHQQHLPAQDIF